MDPLDREMTADDCKDIADRLADEDGNVDQMREILRSYYMAKRTPRARMQMIASIENLCDAEEIAQFQRRETA